MSYDNGEKLVFARGSKFWQQSSSESWEYMYLSKILKDKFIGYMFITVAIIIFIEFNGFDRCIQLDSKSTVEPLYGEHPSSSSLPALERKQLKNHLYCFFDIFASFVLYFYPYPYNIFLIE